MRRYSYAQAWAWLVIALIDFTIWLTDGIEGHWSFLRFLVAGFALLIADYERQSVRLRNELRDLHARVREWVGRYAA